MFIDLELIAEGGIRSQNQRQQSVLPEVIHHVLQHVLAMSFRFQIFLTPGETGKLQSV